MSTLDLSTDSKKKPAQLLAGMSLSDEALALMDDAENTYAYVGALAKGDLFNDAFTALARTLPRQYAIAWAATCLEHWLAADMSDADKECLALAQSWLKGPDEEIRRSAMDAADRFEYTGAGPWLAAAVAFSGGSLAPPNQADVPPPSHLTAVAVAACLLMIAARDPDAMAETCNKMIEKGIEMVAIPGAENSGGRQ